MRRCVGCIVVAGALGCGGAPAAVAESPQFDPQSTAWVLVEANGTALPRDSRPSLAFHPGGALSGRGACNRFAGNYVLKGSVIALDTKHWSALACYPRERMDIDGKFGQDLDRVVRLTLGRDGTLAAHDKNGAVVLRFRRATSGDNVR